MMVKCSHLILIRLIEFNSQTFTNIDLSIVFIDGGVIQQSHAEALNRDQQNNYMILLQQREEENRQEIAKLTAEIKALKVQLLQHRSKFMGRIDPLVRFYRGFPHPKWSYCRSTVLFKT